MVAALYRRYRPESFSEMIGQSQVTEPLMTALRNGRVGHAYLFSGPRGCGKTTSARILARCLNCAEGPTDTPCNVCPSCVELSRDGGGSLDVVEIDAASHGGVDDARDLRERAVFAPARDRFKIFIIDEAHMVTSAGFNALLKIVEEPPPHVKFVFATTEPEKVIGTIRSRTHHYPFRLIAPGTLIDYVQTLCDSESVQVEPGVLPLVVRAGGGSVRDTLSILDQLIAGSETALVTADRAAGLLGFTGTELLDEVVSAFGSHDAAAAFRATDRVVQTGQDPRRFVEDLLERLRDLIVVSATTVDGAAAVFRGVPQDQLTRMFEQAQRFGSGELSRVADVTSETLDRMVGATAPRLQLELMIARALVSLDESRGANVAVGQAGLPHAGAAQGVAAPQGAAVSQGVAPSNQQAPQRPQAQQPQMPQSVQRPQPQQPAQVQQQPAAPAAPVQDPISALAAARNAANEMRQQPAPAPAQAPASAAQAPAPVQPAAQQPNAAQTAASVRDFLREDQAGAAPAAAVPPVVAPPAEAQPAAPQVAAPAVAPETSAAQAAAPQQPAAAVQSQNGSKPHPNEGAAAFGRPISAVLSAAQIESIGTEPVAPAKPAAPAAPAPAPAAAQPAQNTQGQNVQPGQNEQRQNPSGQNPAASQGPVVSQAQQPQQPQQQGDSQQPGVEQPAAEQGDDEFIDNAEGGFSDLLEVWPDLLEEILEQDRVAWNAVKVVQPLSLEGDVLTVGIASRSDLDTFKAVGSGPLREAILSTVGISVRYMPRSMPQGGAQPPRADEPAEPAAEEPHRAPQTATREPQAPALSSDPVERAAARLSALGPALAAPAWADPVPQPQPQPQPPVHASAVLAEAPVQQAPVQTAVPDHAPEATSAPEVVSAPQSVEAPPVSEAPQAVEAPQMAPAPEPVEPAPVEPEPVEPEPVAPETSEATSFEPVASAVSEEVKSAEPVVQEKAPDSDSDSDSDPAPAAAAPYSDDPYANDPYAGEPSDDGFDDPYASGSGYSSGHGSGPAKAAAPTELAAPVADRRVPADPEPRSNPTTPAAPATPVAPATPAASLAAALAGPETAAPEAPEVPGKQQKTQQSAPSFVRYGEAVVRETLGARFVKEIPLPGSQQN